MVRHQLPFSLAEQILCGDGATTCEELPHIADGFTLDGERLANVTANRKSCIGSFALEDR